MSENLHEIDKLFHDALNNLEDQPSQGVWENIEQRLDVQAKPGGSGWQKPLAWSLVGGVILLSSLYWFLTTRSTKENPAPITSSSTKASNIVAADSQQQHPSISIKQQSPPATDISEGRKTALPAEDKTAGLTSDSIDIQNSGGKKQQTADVTAENIGYSNISDDKTLTEQNTAQNPKAFNAKKQNDQRMAAVFAVNNINSSSNGMAANASYESVAQNRESGNTPVMNNAFIYHFTELLHSSGITAPFISKTTPTVQQALYQSLAKQAASKQHYQIATASAVKLSPQKTPLQFSLTGFYRFEFPGARMENDHHDGRMNDRHAIREKEETNNSFTTGINGELLFGKHWGVVSGVNFFQQKTTIEPHDVVARPDEEGHIRFRYDCAAGYAFLSPKDGSPPALGDTAQSLAGMNTLAYVGVPVAASYHAQVGKWQLVPQAGVQLQFLAKGTLETGLITSTSNSKTTTATPVTGLKPMYVSGSVGVGIEYGVSKRINLVAAPSYRFAITSINKNASVKTYPKAAGIGIGIKWKF